MQFICWNWDTSVVGTGILHQAIYILSFSVITESLIHFLVHPVSPPLKIHMHAYKNVCKVSGNGLSQLHNVFYYLRMMKTKAGDKILPSPQNENFNT